MKNEEAIETANLLEAGVIHVRWEFFWKDMKRSKLRTALARMRNGLGVSGMDTDSGTSHFPTNHTLHLCFLGFCHEDVCRDTDLSRET